MIASDALKNSLADSRLPVAVTPPPVVIYLKLFICSLFWQSLRSWISRDILWLICGLIWSVLEALVDTFGQLSVV